jgi:CrcB protein
MIATLWVALGSALGGAARYGFGLMAGRLWGDSFPWGTIAINVLGSFVIGCFAALTVPGGAMPASPNLRVFVMVGICGGFTTFSSFSLQTLGLARDGSWLGAMANVLLSVILCLLAVTAGHYSAERIGAWRAAGSAVPHTILAILDRPQAAHAVLAAASLVSQRLGNARIEALHLRHDGVAGFMPTEEVMTRQREREIDGTAARQSADMQAVFAAWRGGGGTAEWRELAGDTGGMVASEAAGAGLVVIGHSARGTRGDAREAIHAALFDARRPTLLVPETVPAALGRSVAVAWKSSATMDRAFEAALPLLRRAEQVTILVETGDAGQAPLPPGVLQRLQQADVAVTVRWFHAQGRTIGQALIEEAHRAGADLLVMGAYAHGRLAEVILGGATREVLAAADLPVLMQH